MFFGKDDDADAVGARGDTLILEEHFILTVWDLDNLCNLIKYRGSTLNKVSIKAVLA